MKYILSFVLMLTLSARSQSNSVVWSYNSFGFKLLTQVHRSNPDKNIFLSPPGVGFALSMVANGAKGETLRQIKAVLRLDESADLNAANQALLEENLGPKIKLEIANGLWADTKLKPKFLATTRQAYHAEAASVDFKDPQTVKSINDWVSAQTQGKITEMVQAPLDPTLRLIVMNAIYFKGNWTVPFDPKQTHDLPFTLGNGQTVSQPRMSRTGDFEYFENDAFQEVRLPYADGEASLDITLPRKNLDDLFSPVTANGPPLHFRKGTVELPRFKLKNSYALNDALTALGMPLAFTRQADFSGIASESLYIGWVKQKTFVEVNEEGTEAAAATGVGMRAMAVHREPPPFRMVMDRPFLVSLIEKKTGLILFLGVIVDPRSNE